MCLDIGLQCAKSCNEISITHAALEAGKQSLNLSQRVIDGLVLLRHQKHRLCHAGKLTVRRKIGKSGMSSICAI